MLSDNYHVKARLRRGSLASNTVFFFFIFICVAYYITFATVFDGNQFFENSANFHDHDIYLQNIYLIEHGDGLFELANDKGIAGIYLILSKVFPFLVTPDMALIAFIFNSIILSINYKIYINIANRLNLGDFGRLSFFVNLREPLKTPP